MMIEEITKAEQQATEQLQDCYQQLQAKHSNVVLEILQAASTVQEWQHYPPKDVVDKQRHSQYYYHAHRSQDADRVPEHGHFHIFLRKAAFPKTTEPLHVSEKYRLDNKKDALCHVAAIAMNEQGYPTALFTTNHWVTKGLWYRADEIYPLLDSFSIQSEKHSALANQWVTALMQLFKRPLIALLQKRDEIIQEWQETHPEESVFNDRRLEITSVLRLP